MFEATIICLQMRRYYLCRSTNTYIYVYHGICYNYNKPDFVPRHFFVSGWDDLGGK